MRCSAWLRISSCALEPATQGAVARHVIPAPVAFKKLRRLIDLAVVLSALICIPFGIGVVRLR
jgi:hypothetical protein